MKISVRMWILALFLNEGGHGEVAQMMSIDNPLTTNESLALLTLVLKQTHSSPPGFHISTTSKSPPPDTITLYSRQKGTPENNGYQSILCLLWFFFYF